jgi:predicted RecB family nuclease
MSQTKPPILSKSRFLAGRQCQLRLWYACYNREFATETSRAQQAVFDTGHDIGELATHLYPGGILIEEDHLHHEEAVQSTIAAMKDRRLRAIFEAAFVHDRVRIRADILERQDNGKWNLIEVKSSTSVKDVYHPDVAVQYYVLRGAGLDIDRVYLMHVNNQYVYDGNNLDVESLFKLADLTDEAISQQAGTMRELTTLKEMLTQSEPPAIEPSRHCHTPYGCEFWEHCTKPMPEHWVFRLSGIGQNRLNELASLGITEIRDIPRSFPLSPLQERIRQCVVNGEDWISEELEEKLNDAQYPIHFLDFETFSDAIPRYTGTHPYEGIPFQWSDHILYEDGTLEHLDYLCLEDKDPREEFAQTLLDALEAEGSIVTYTNFEKAVIKSLAEYLPDCTNALLATVDRLVDLYDIIRKHYYHPQFHGSFSIKSVLPALSPDMNYDDLAIQEGQQAGPDYLRMIDPTTSPEEKAKIEEDLLIYCAQDTLAMVKIREELLKRSSFKREFQ